MDFHFSTYYWTQFSLFRIMDTFCNFSKKCLLNTWSNFSKVKKSQKVQKITKFEDGHKFYMYIKQKKIKIETKTEKMKFLFSICRYIKKKRKKVFKYIEQILLYLQIVDYCHFGRLFLRHKKFKLPTSFLRLCTK